MGVSRASSEGCSNSGSRSARRAWRRDMVRREIGEETVPRTSIILRVDRPTEPTGSGAGAGAGASDLGTTARLWKEGLLDKMKVGALLVLTVRGRQ
jgi:hypothetical protein